MTRAQLLRALGLSNRYGSRPEGTKTLFPFGSDHRALEAHSVGTHRVSDGPYSAVLCPL